MQGVKGKLPKMRLYKLPKNADQHDLARKPPFKFARGSTHTFKLRGQNIGELKSVTVDVSVKSTLHFKLVFFLFYLLYLSLSMVSTFMLDF